MRSTELEFGESHYRAGKTECDGAIRQWPGSQSPIWTIIHSQLASAAAIAVALALTGCGHQEDAGLPGTDDSSEAGVKFNAKKGLLVPPATAKFIGLQVADVEERNIAATFQFPAQVYRAAGEMQFATLVDSGSQSALASGNVSPAHAARLSEGQTVIVQSGNDGLSLPGRIVALNRGLEKSSGQVEVLLAVADARRALATGESLSVTIHLKSEKSVVSVPQSALFRTTEGDFVYTVSGEHFVRTPVKLGVVNHEFAEVTDGLYAGDQVAVQPVMTLWMAELQSLRGGKACADGQ